MRSMSAQWQLPYFSLLFAHCKSIALEAQCDVLRKYKIFAMFIDAPLFCPSASKNCGEGNWDADAVSSQQSAVAASFALSACSGRTAPNDVG